MRAESRERGRDRSIGLWRSLALVSPICCHFRSNSELADTSDSLNSRSPSGPSDLIVPPPPFFSWPALCCPMSSSQISRLQMLRTAEGTTVLAVAQSRVPSRHSSPIHLAHVSFIFIFFALSSSPTHHPSHALHSRQPYPGALGRPPPACSLPSV